MYWKVQSPILTHWFIAWDFLGTENHASYAVNTYFWRNPALQAVILLLCELTLILAASSNDIDYMSVASILEFM